MRRRGLVRAREQAPEFTAESSNGAVSLADLRGRFVVMVFYPGDDTPVCTKQLCEFRDNWKPLQSRNVVVLGVNPASVERHVRFAARRSLPFPLLSDPGGAIAEAYGARGLFGLTRRSVVVIAPDGTIAYARSGRPSSSELIGCIDARTGTPSDQFREEIEPTAPK